MDADNQKPEWFQMTQGDEIPARPRIKRGLRAFAVTLPLLLLGAGFLVAQPQDGPGAVATQTIALASSGPSAPAVASTSATVVVTAQSPTSVATVSTQSTHTTTSATFTTSPIKPPTGGGEGGDDAPTIGPAPAIGTPPSIKAPTDGDDD